MSASIFALFADAPSAVEVRVPGETGPSDGESSFEGILNGMQEFGGNTVTAGDGTVQVKLPPVAEPPDGAEQLTLAGPRPVLIDLIEELQRVSAAASELHVVLPGKADAGDSEPKPTVMVQSGSPDGASPVGRPDADAGPAARGLFPDFVAAARNGPTTDGVPRPAAVPDVSVMVWRGQDGTGQVVSAPPAGEVLSEVGEKSEGQAEPVVPSEGDTERTVPVQTGQDARGRSPEAAPGAASHPQETEGKPPDASVPLAQTVGARSGAVRQATVADGREPSPNPPGGGPTGEKPGDVPSTGGVDTSGSPGVQSRPAAAAPAESFTTEGQTREQSSGSDRSEGRGVMTAGPASETVERPAGPEVETRPSGVRVDMAGFVDRVVRFVRTMTSREESSVEMRLHPPELGNVRLSMSMNHGELRMTLETSTEAARQIIAGNVGQLRTTLAQQGYDVTRVDVSVGQGFAETQTSHSDPEPEHFSHGRSDTSFETDVAFASERPMAWVYTSRYLDLVA